jgi:hypothetical protein
MSRDRDMGRIAFRRTESIGAPKLVFDTISHAWLTRFIEHRIGDRRIVRLIRKWLAAGALHHCCGETITKHPLTKHPLKGLGSLRQS